MKATEPSPTNAASDQHQKLLANPTETVQPLVQREARFQLPTPPRSYVAWQALRRAEFLNPRQLHEEFEDIGGNLSISPEMARRQAVSYYTMEFRYRNTLELDDLRLDETGYRSSENEVDDSQVDESML